MNKIVDALKKLLPDAEINEVATAVEEMLESAKKELEKEYNQKLEDAYSELSEELKNAEKIAEEGYSEAYGIIGELRTRLELQGEEYQAALKEGYDEAYAKIKAIEAEKKAMEVDMYEEFNGKLSEMKEYMVDKVDQFLQFKGAEIYEQAKRDILNDPAMAEHKVALDKIVEVTSQYLSEEDFNGATSRKLQEAEKTNEELKGQIKLMESRTIRLDNENIKLKESVRQASELIAEQKKNTSSKKKEEVIVEQKERAKTAREATAQGNITDDAVVIKEFNNHSTEMDDLLKLAGVNKK